MAWGIGAGACALANFCTRLYGMEIATVQEMHRLPVFIYICRHFRFGLGSLSSRLSTLPFLLCHHMTYVVIRTKFAAGREQTDVSPHLFVRLTAARQHARQWKRQDGAMRRRHNRFVYSVHKVCLVPDYTTTLWRI